MLLYYFEEYFSAEYLVVTQALSCLGLELTALASEDVPGNSAFVLVPRHIEPSGSIGATSSLRAILSFAESARMRHPITNPFACLVPGLTLDVAACAEVRRSGLLIEGTISDFVGACAEKRRRLGPSELEALIEPAKTRQLRVILHNLRGIEPTEATLDAARALVLRESTHQWNPDRLSSLTADELFDELKRDPRNES